MSEDRRIDLPGPPPRLPPPALHLPYEAGPFRMALGLVAIPASAWIEMDGDYPAHLAERRRLMATRRQDVIDALPGTEPAQNELLLELASHLARHHPAWFHLAGTALENRLTGETCLLGTDEPLGAAGRLVQEDFCLMREEEAGLRLIAAVLCFPSRWRLADKMDRLMGAIHGPVPFYADRLARPVDRFMRLLKPGRMVKRLNWSLMDDAALFQPSGHGRATPTSAITPDNAGTKLVLRVERQTLRRLPQTGAIAFGIRVHVTALAAVMAVPGEAARLREATLALPPDMDRYKSMLPFRPALLAYLERRAAEPSRAADGGLEGMIPAARGLP